MVVNQLYAQRAAERDVPLDRIEVAEDRDLRHFDPSRLDFPHQLLLAEGFRPLATLKLLDPSSSYLAGVARQWVHDKRCITCTLSAGRHVLLIDFLKIKITHTIRTRYSFSVGSAADDGTVIITRQDGTPTAISSGFIHTQSVETTTPLPEMVQLHEAFVSTVLVRRSEELGRAVALKPVSTIEQVRAIEIDMQKRVTEWRKRHGYLTPEELNAALVGVSEDQRRAEMIRLKYLRARDGFDTVLPVEAAN